MTFMVRRFMGGACHEFDADTAGGAVDAAARHVDWDAPGDVIFLEVSQADWSGDVRWDLWHVERSVMSPFVTVVVSTSTPDVALAEIAAAAETEMS